MKRDISNNIIIIVVVIILATILLVIFYKGMAGFAVLGSIDASRDFSVAEYNVDEGFDVSIRLTDSGLDSVALGIIETVPLGWEVQTASHKGIIKGNKVEWLLVPPKFETLTYRVVPKTAGGGTFSGVWMTEDLEENIILGKTQIDSGVAAPICGNGSLEGIAQCDDGNLINGDGCSANCINELPVKPVVCTNANVLLASMDDLTGLTCSGNTCPTVVTGRVGGALSFDGTDDFVTAPASITGSEGTFSLWAKFDSTLLANNKGHVVIGIGNSVGDQNYVDLRKLVSNDFVFRYRKSGTDYEVKRAGMGGADSWHYYTAVWNANEIKLYIDGVLIGTTASLSSTGQFGQFRIGSRGFQTPALYFKGQIDEVYVWNRALTESEVQELYNECFG